MTDIKQALKKRASTKKPDFLIKESKFSARVKKRWRFPRGKQSKVRQMHRGRQAMPTPGYGAPAVVRGLDASGLVPVVVAKVADLEKLDAATQGVVVSGKVGNKRRLEILQSAESKKLTILNHKKEAASVIEKAFAQRKQTKQARTKQKSEKEAKQKADAKKAEEKKKAEAKVEKKDATDNAAQKEEKQKEEQKLAEKVITQKQ